MILGHQTTQRASNKSFRRTSEIGLKKIMDETSKFASDNNKHPHSMQN